MRPVEARELFAEELTFPTTRSQAIAAIGDRELEAPNGANRTLAEVLARCPEAEFQCATGLYEEMMEFLDVGFVGRTEYDDRSRTPRTGVTPVSL
jgi:hypothetical protein